MRQILFVTEKARMDLKVSSPIKGMVENAGFEVVVFNDNTTMDELCAKMTDKVVALMQEIELPSMKATGYTLEDCQSVSVRMPDDAAFLGIPKETMPQDEIKSFIQVAYEAYQ